MREKRKGSSREITATAYGRNEGRLQGVERKARVGVDRLGAVVVAGRRLGCPFVAALG
jgi:hypothetical protein